VTTALTRSRRLSLATFCRATGLHPELVGRLVRLGLIDASEDARGQPVFDVAEVRRAGRIARLRAGLSLNYAAVGLVLDLLDRIDALEAAQRRPVVRATVRRSTGGDSR
jgi:chaperone modulatory protein CbpM